MLLKRRNFIKTAAASTIGLGLSSQTLSIQNNPTKILKAGIIGLDTSHSVAFTKVLNDPDVKDDLKGIKVVAAYPHGSKDIESSVSRIPKYTEEIQAYGVEIVDSIEKLLNLVDVVLLETNDGRRHLEQAMMVFKAAKPVFIDKPIAASLSDTIAIFDAAEKYNVPVFSASSLRYAKDAQAVRSGKKIGNVLGADTYSPAHLEETHPDFYWYGVHGVELLYTVMKTGCKTVKRSHTKDMDVVVGHWDGGRIGTFRGMRKGKLDYGGTAYGENAISSVGPYDGYRPLVVEIVNFFKSGKPPVEAKETIEIFAFMEAADESKRQGGIEITLDYVMQKAMAGIKRN
ncbi:Gfo/Idh/MocA family oxidoreductase [Porifericola rhodea]|uniref:Gfo/Idh/MocA family protein n=1 Tax=Porifericola rhodea TaxID=930972 RepID=UPI002666D757|nr:Gfo/Idh/MocA family oxidoreductase [Porifericola rhodea]WKN30847.1 Gfo/Idh/MocA family oxidoreductase [Porifericola rhodea]